jgi:hypothetical protein
MNESLQPQPGSEQSVVHRDPSHRGVTPTTMVGWRLSCDVVKEVIETAREYGVRPGALVTGILREQIALLRQPISSAELERRIRYRY